MVNYYTNIRKDLIILSAISGFIGTLFKTIYSGVPFLLKISNDYGVIIAGRIIFHVKHFPLDLLHLSLALLTHLVIGSMIGIALGIIYLLSGKDFYLFKSALFGLAVWFILRNLLVTLFVPGERGEIDAITTIVSFSSHTLYGLITGYIIAKYNRFTPNT